MHKIDTLKMSIFKDEWFALENEDMNPSVYEKLVNSLNKVFTNEYGVEGAKEHVNKVAKDDKLVLFINAKKVPNIIKSLVQMPNYDIQIELKGKTNTGEEKTKTISKPFDSNSCAEVIPYYNKNVRKQ